MNIPDGNYKNDDDNHQSLVAKPYSQKITTSYPVMATTPLPEPVQVCTKAAAGSPDIIGDCNISLPLSVSFDRNFFS